MCGIAGIVNFDLANQVNRERLISMRDSLLHRGPDSAGLYMNEEVGLVHRRLSIIDLSERANQPFISVDNRFVVIFNGEIFNYRELRRQLEIEGHCFSSDSDTEVLLCLFMKLGPKCLELLNGMFAFAVWDSHEHTLFVARDRVGVKPLYYSVYNEAFYFASEPKAIFSAGVPVDVNHGVMQELLLFKYVAGENTVFQGVSRLLPGHYVVVRRGSIRKTRWWDLRNKIKANRENLPKDPYEWFSEIFHSSVNYRTISDVPVGVMLSGGLDSSSVAAALMKNGNKNLAAFTYVFQDQRYNEGPLAARIASKFGLDLHTVELNDEDLIRAVETSAWLYDEPMVHQNDAQMLALSKEAKKYVTVLLSGEGADEFMGGYVRYKPLNYISTLRFAGWASSLLKYIRSGDFVNRFEKLDRYLKDQRLRSLVLLNASNVYPYDLKEFGVNVDPENFEYRNSVFDEAIDLYPAEPARQAMYLDIFVHMSSVLDRNDRMTMGAGIECRVPFLDYRLMEMIPALPSANLLKGKKGKHLLFASVAQQLPREVLRFRKLGFSVPWEQLMNRNGFFQDSLSNISSGSLRDIFPGLNAKRLIERSEAHNSFSSAMLRQLVMADVWRQQYLKKFHGLL